MELLPFRMPPFARLIWVSSRAKEVWGERIEVAKRTYARLEQETVKAGLRSCTTLHIAPDQLTEMVANLAEQGLVFLPLRKVGSYKGFAHSHPPVVEGKSWSYYGVVARNLTDALSFKQASVDNDHVTLGNLLGYPTCCTSFFNEVWTAGYIDPIWQQASNSGEAIINTSPQSIMLSSVHRYNSSMLRYVGLRLTPHLPCSFTCEATDKMALSWIKLGRELALEGLDDLITILQFPIEWDCLKGIANISTPIFKIVTNSMPTTERYIVQKKGTVYPDEAPSALKFPWVRLKSQLKKVVDQD